MIEDTADVGLSYVGFHCRGRQVAIVGVSVETCLDALRKEF